MERLPRIALIYDRRKKAGPRRKAVLEIRITYNGRQRYISTGIMLYPNEWKKGEITGRCDALQLNQAVSRMVTEIRNILMSMSERGPVDIFADDLKQGKQGRGAITLRGFLEQRADVRRYGYSKACGMRYSRLLKVLEGWGMMKRFEDVNDSNILKLDRYLKEMGLRENSRWSNYHKLLNALLSDALNEGLIPYNPYKRIHLGRGDESMSLYKYLTPAELQMLEDCPMPTLSLERVRDLFLFQTYTCLSYVDLMGFDSSRIQEIEGMMAYTGKRGKTGKPFTVPLVPKALLILEKYGFNLPHISNVKYNEYLKKVSSVCNINKPLSTHWARHTGATLFLNMGIDMGIVSRICGHSSTRITEKTYARLLDETVVSAVKKILK